MTNRQLTALPKVVFSTWKVTLVAGSIPASCIAFQSSFFPLTSWRKSTTSRTVTSAVHLRQRAVQDGVLLLLRRDVPPQNSDNSASNRGVPNGRCFMEWLLWVQARFRHAAREVSARVETPYPQACPGSRRAG